MMDSIKRLASKTLDAVMRRLAGSAGGRHVLQRSIDNAQGWLGIGIGAEVDSSGEQVIINILRKMPTSTRPLCVFDVGANKGEFAKLVLSGLGHEAVNAAAKRAVKIYCFEPSPSTFAMLKANVGDQPEVVFNPCGLGKEAGEFELFSDEPGSGMASLTKRRLDHVGIQLTRQEQVQIRTLDGYCDEQKIEQIDLLKLDVEGNELDVLKGGVRMFTERRVAAASFEFGGCNIDSRTFFQDFFYFFKEHGMPAIFRIMRTGGLQPIDSYSETLEQFRTTNFLVLRDGDALAAK